MVFDKHWPPARSYLCPRCSRLVRHLFSLWTSPMPLSYKMLVERATHFSSWTGNPVILVVLGSSMWKAICLLQCNHCVIHMAQIGVIGLLKVTHAHSLQEIKTRIWLKGAVYARGHFRNTTRELSYPRPLS